jgi:hypothetical protein
MQPALACTLHEPAAHWPLHELLVEPPVPNRPAAQLTHATCPWLLVNSPDAQRAQCDTLLLRTVVATPFRPAAQPRHILAPPPLYWPSMHITHAVEARVFSLRVPAEQAPHDDEFAKLDLPASHAEQSSTPAPLNRPAAHPLQSSCAPVSWCFPAGQAKQNALPLACWKLPKEHATHSTWLALSWYLPAAHNLQSAALAMSWYFPTAH